MSIFVFNGKYECSEKHPLMQKRLHQGVSIISHTSVTEDPFRNQYNRTAACRNLEKACAKPR